MYPQFLHSLNSFIHNYVVYCVLYPMPFFTFLDTRSTNALTYIISRDLSVASLPFCLYLYSLFFILGHVLQLQMVIAGYIYYNYEHVITQQYVLAVESLICA